MWQLSSSQLLFLDIVKSGLWKIFERGLDITKEELEEAYRMALEQSVPVLFAASLNQYRTKFGGTQNKVPKNVLLTVIGETLQLEQ